MWQSTTGDFTAEVKGGDPDMATVVTIKSREVVEQENEEYQKEHPHTNPLD